jgi:hypothetical protein
MVNRGYTLEYNRVACFYIRPWKREVNSNDVYIYISLSICMNDERAYIWCNITPVKPSGWQSLSSLGPSGWHSFFHSDNTAESRRKVHSLFSSAHSHLQIKIVATTKGRRCCLTKTQIFFLCPFLSSTVHTGIVDALTQSSIFLWIHVSYISMHEQR